MSIQDRERTLENIAHLRQAEQQARMPEVAAVREDLESQLGGTVPRSSAARLLGVSHTALNKWIASGDVPTVITKQGRKEVPIPPLLELREQVVAQHHGGRRKLHRLEPAMIEARRRAEQMRPRVESPPRRAEPHRAPELRGLAYHRALAPRLRRPMIEEAEGKLRRWEEEGRAAPRHVQSWKEVFVLPMPEIRKIIAADDERGRDLRQNSPLAGMLSEPERRKIIEAV